MSILRWNGEPVPDAGTSADSIDFRSRESLMSLATSRHTIQSSPATPVITDQGSSILDLEKSPKPRGLLTRLGKRLTRKTRPRDDLHEPFPPIAMRVEETEPGYPHVAAFQSSDPGFQIYRRFGYLHCRVASLLQYEIVTLEAELDLLDKRDRDSDGGRRLSSFTYGTHDPQAAEKREILYRLKTKLQEYDEWLHLMKQSESLKKPTTQQYESLVNWFSNSVPVVEKETTWIRHKDDLVTLKAA